MIYLLISKKIEKNLIQPTKSTTKMTNAFSKTFNVFTNTEALNTLKDKKILKMMGYNYAMCPLMLGVLEEHERRLGVNRLNLILQTLGNYLECLMYRPIYISYIH